MASSGRDKSRKAHGIRIDSSLISTASSDVQNELHSLGVSVYDQGTFEEGVMKQLDEEVSRQTAEQKWKFLIEEYSQVKRERSFLRHELDTISKKIAGLLSRPLCDVVLTLREMKSTQEQKRKQLVQLEKREKQLLKRISGEEEDTGREEGEALVADAAFSIPLTSQSSEQQRLIQCGQMTPFGSAGQEEEGGVAAGERRVEGAAGTSEGPGQSDSISSGGGVAGYRAVGERDGESLSNSEGRTDRENSVASVGSGLRLCSEGFDGLFQDVATSERPAEKKGPAGPGSGKKGKGKGRAKGVLQEKESLSCGFERNGRVLLQEEGTVGEYSGDIGREEKKEEEEEVGDGDYWIPTREEVEAMEREMMEEDEEEEGEGRGGETTEYSTDEELGADHVLEAAGLGFKKKKRKKMRRRPLSGGESEDGEEEEGRWGRRGSRRQGRRRSSALVNQHQDDGDEELFRLRISQYEREQEDSDTATHSTSDKVFDSRLRIPGSVWSRLYGYQQTGVQWLWELHCQQAGGVVGDEMGLGKTIQMIAFLAGLRVSKLRSHVTGELGLGPILIVCPATVMHQWVSEFHKWWAPFRVAVLHETGTYQGPKEVLVNKIVRSSGVLITTYSGVRIYREPLLAKRWDYVILDEGHKIRNPDTEVTLVCKQFPTPHRIILSGSPMQNNLRELWSLFDFVFPGKLGTLPVFMEQFSVPITLGGYANATQVQVQTAYRCASILRDTINPYLLRRLKADVKLQLPSKNEQVLFCKLTDYQRELYEDYITGPDVAAMMVGRKKIFTGLTVLRKLCNHPDLVTNDYRECVTYGREEGEEEGEEECVLIPTKALQRRRKRNGGNSGGGAEGCYGEEKFGWGQRSGKMMVVEALLKMWHNQRHRVLLFSQSRMMLDILEQMIQSKGYTYLRMDGSTPIAARQPLIHKFNEDSSIFLFLLTTRVGGLGVNLTGANRVVIYDPDWNPSTDTQARERAWRIGQKRQVTIYRLLTSGTIEEKIYHRQIFKQFLTNRVLKDPRQRRFFKSNDLYELFSLGQVAPSGQTETSAIFAGTGSDVLPEKQKRKRSHGQADELCNTTTRSRDQDGRSLVSAGKRKRSEQEGKKERTKRKKLDGSGGGGGGGGGGGSKEEKGREEGCVGVREVASEEQIKSAQEGDISSPSTSGVAGLNTGPSSSVAAEVKSEVDEEKEEEPTSQDQFASQLGGQEMEEEIETGGRRTRRRRKKEKKEKRKKKSRSATVEGMSISGVERTGVFAPGGRAEGERRNHSQDEYILNKLFKKSAVHSAVQHDSIMNSGDPDYVLVEAEAKKVAQSAARALRESRRRCLGSGWGTLTWTGQHGTPGGLGRPRFGAKGQGPSSLKSTSAPSSSQHFNGQSAGSSLLPSSPHSSHSTSTNLTSSSLLLMKMRSRNAHSLPQNAVTNVHQSTHDQLLKEIRDYIATQCKVDGQATTEELLTRFASRLPTSDTAMFRSMLREICDFARVHGEGQWILKPQFR